jgi:hypothetical protein
VTAASRYGLGLVLVGAATLGVSTLLTGADRRGVLIAFAITLVVQAPLGWWLIRSVGRSSAFAAWVVGMMVRLGVLGVVGLVLVPRLGWPAAPTLIGMAVLVVALLLVEGVVLWFEHFGSKP